MGTKRAEEALEALRDRLQEERNGTKLSEFMVDALMLRVGPTLANTEEAANLTIEDLLDEFPKAWVAQQGTAPIDLVTRRVEKWAGSRIKPLVKPSADPLLEAALKELGGGGKGEALPGRSGARRGSMADALEEQAELEFPELNVRTLQLVKSDVNAQRISGTRILALSGAVELGRAMRENAVVGESYGSNPLGFAAIKTAAKYSVTLTKLLAAVASGGPLSTTSTASSATTLTRATWRRRRC